MSTETLNFAINLSGTYWQKRPQFSIWLDDQLVVASEIVATDSQIVKFDRTLFYGSHDIKIRLENKTSADTTKDSQGNIYQDMLLNINDIVIDDMSVGMLRYSAEYILDSQQEYQGQMIKSLDRCVNLGWNGTYIFKFQSPFYVWLLEKL